jgi:hypothetical protein
MLGLTKPQTGLKSPENRPDMFSLENFNPGVLKLVTSVALY